MTKTPKKDETNEDAVERMNKALRAALSTPPTKHKDEPKRPRARNYVRAPKDK